LKVAPGTLENARRGRLKERPQSLAEVAKGAWIRELEREIQALAHEVQILRASGVAPDENEVLKAETLLAKARKLLRG
jgi:hypothetical protein